MSVATWPTSWPNGRTVVEGRHPRGDGDRNDRAQLEADARLTRELMHQGADVIYQATLFDGTWRGYADFLLRTDGASNLGGHHYEVADTKLARRVKGGALLQMCVYSDLVAAIQGVMPTQMHVVLGGSGYQEDSHRLDDYLAYYRSVKGRFLEAIAAGDPVFPLPQTPEPVRHCDVCRWQPTCDGWRKAADHLSQVASLRTDQARRLRAGGIGTMTALATLEPPLPEVTDMADATLAGLHQQARLQYASRESAGACVRVPAGRAESRAVRVARAKSRRPVLRHRGRPVRGDRTGWSTCSACGTHPVPRSRSAPSGVMTGRRRKLAFEAFVDFVMARWQASPDMHVYHYAAYERGRMGMLSTRHATREAEVDKMLTAELFVDLYKVVRQSMRIGLDSYSIKRLEPLYALDREAPLKDAGSSIVAYERYIRSVSAGAPDTAILEEIRLYNQDDCRSNAELRDWLEGQRTALALQLGMTDLDRRTPPEEKERPSSQRDERVADLARQLLEGIPTDPERRKGDPALQARWLLANLLEWHRREEKVDWWAFFDRCTRSDEELATWDDEAIGQIRWMFEVDRPRKSVVHRYRLRPRAVIPPEGGRHAIQSAHRPRGGHHRPARRPGWHA